MICICRWQRMDRVLGQTHEVRSFQGDQRVPEGSLEDLFCVATPMYAHGLCVTLKCLQHIWPLIFSPMVRWTIFLVPSRLVGKTDCGETSPRCRPVWERRRVITPSEMTLDEFVSSTFMLYTYLPPTQHMLEGAYHIITHSQELNFLSFTSALSLSLHRSVTLSPRRLCSHRTWSSWGGSGRKGTPERSGSSNRYETLTPSGNIHPDRHQLSFLQNCLIH